MSNGDRQLMNPSDGLECAELDPAMAGLVWALSSYVAAQMKNPDYRERWFKSMNAVWDLLYPESIRAPREIEVRVPITAEEPSEVQPRRRGRPPKIVNRVTETVVAQRTEESESEGAGAGETDGSETDDDLEPKIYPTRYEEVRQPMPYRGSKQAAEIVRGLIQQVGKPGHVWLMGDGRVKVCGPEFRPPEDARHVGTYTVLDPASRIAADLRAIGSNL